MRPTSAGGSRPIMTSLTQNGPDEIMTLARLGEPVRRSRWVQIGGAACDLRSVTTTSMELYSPAVVSDGRLRSPLRDRCRYSPGCRVRGSGLRSLCRRRSSDRTELRDHAVETGARSGGTGRFPEGPSALIGPNDDVLIPRTSAKTDWGVGAGYGDRLDGRYLDSPDDARWGLVEALVQRKEPPATRSVDAQDREACIELRWGLGVHTFGR